MSLPFLNLRGSLPYMLQLGRIKIPYINRCDGVFEPFEGDLDQNHGREDSRHTAIPSRLSALESSATVRKLSENSNAMRVMEVGF